MEKGKYNNATISETLDNLVGEKGLKTDLTVKIAPSTIPLVFLSVTLAVIAGILTADLIRKKLIK